MAPMLQFIVWGKTYCLIMSFGLFVLFISMLVEVFVGGGKSNKRQKCGS